MLRSLAIENYRGFDKFKVEPLANVNLIVGRNNVGKTALLEAVQLFVSPALVSNLREISLRRGETELLASPSSQSSIEVASIKGFFHGHRFVNNTQFRMWGDQAELVVRIVPTMVHNQLGTTPRELLESDAFAVVGSRDGSQFDSGTVSTGGLILDDERYLTARFAVLEKSAPCIYLALHSLSAFGVRQMLDQVIVRSNEDVLEDAVRTLDAKVRKIHFRPNFGSGNLGILLEHETFGRVPIGSFGDGMQRLLATAMAFVNARRGTLLIDEVDTGLHYSVMPDLWKSVTTWAKEFDVQVFLTTHSLDCVRGLREVLEVDPALAAGVAIHKISSRLDFAASFTGDELIRALRQDVELR